MIDKLKQYWQYVVIAVLIAALVVMYRYRPEPEPQVQYQQIETIREVERIKRVEVPVEKIVVIEKAALDKELDPAPAILNNPALQALAVGVVQPYDGETRVVATINIDTGEGRIESQRLPRKWFELKNEWEIGPTYSLWAEDATATDRIGLMGMWSPLRVGSVHLHLIGQLRRDEQRAEVWLGWRPR